MPDVTTLVDTYIALWNEADPARRRALVEQTFTADGEYLDPLMRGEGTDGIDAMVAAAQAQFPGTRFVLHAGPTRTTTASASRGSCSPRPAATRSPPATTTASSTVTAASRPSPGSWSSKDYDVVAWNSEKAAPFASL